MKGEEIGLEPPKELARRKSKGKIRNTIPFSKSSSRFGTELVVYPMHTAIILYNRVMTFRLSATCILRDRSSPGRGAVVGWTSRLGTVPPRKRTTIQPEESVSVVFPPRDKKFAIAGWREFYSLSSKASISLIDPDIRKRFFTLVKFVAFLSRSPCFFTFCLSFLC